MDDVAPKKSLVQEGLKEKTANTEDEGSPTKNPDKKTPTPPKTKDLEDRVNEDNKDSEANNTPSRPSIRTYEADAAEVLSGQGQSLSKIALAEQKKRAKKATQKKPGSENKVRPIFIVAIALLVVLSLGVLSFVFFFGESEEPHEERVLPESIIFADSDLSIQTQDLEGENLAKELNNIRENYGGSLGSIQNIYLLTGQDQNQRILTTQEFLNRLNIRAEGSLIRNLEQEMMFGIHAFDGNQGFLIFKVDNFDVVFARMLDWERNMFSDLDGLFYGSVETELNFSEEDPRGTVGQFKDRVFKNRDIRIFEDNSGETALVYSFPNRQTLVITSDTGTLNEIFSRMTATRFDN